MGGKQTFSSSAVPISSDSSAVGLAGSYLSAPESPSIVTVIFVFTVLPVLASGLTVLASLASSSVLTSFLSLVVVSFLLSLALLSFLLSCRDPVLLLAPVNSTQAVLLKLGYSNLIKPTKSQLGSEKDSDLPSQPEHCLNLPQTSVTL